MCLQPCFGARVRRAGSYHYCLVIGVITGNRQDLSLNSVGVLQNQLANCVTEHKSKCTDTPLRSHIQDKYKIEVLRQSRKMALGGAKSDYLVGRFIGTLKYLECCSAQRRTDLTSSNPTM